MNLHGIASAAIASVNPMAPVTIQLSQGYSTAADGTQIPAYSAPITAQAQIQALTFRDLQQIDGLNLNGTRRAIYLFGDIQGVVRVSSKGGDLITFADGSIWLTALALETWPDWCKIVATLQDGS